jgi:hypothetical protein
VVALTVREKLGNLPPVYWEITQDFIDTDAVGTAGPGRFEMPTDGWPVTVDMAQFGPVPPTGPWRYFRLFDDDGELYYEGRIFIRSDVLSEELGYDTLERAEFAPLWNFGQPSAGCTMISYLVDGEWEQL